MEWIYVEDRLPKKQPGADLPPMCLVSATDENGRNYVTQAAYYGKEGWMDIELRAHNVYAWCIPSPAPKLPS